MFLSASEVKRVPDTARDGLYGPVRLIREYRSFETQERPNYKSERFQRLKGSPYLTVSYNEKGDMTEQSFQHGPPKIVYSYDVDGSRIVNHWYDGRATGSGLPKDPVPGRPYEEQYKYDAFGRRVEMSIKDAPNSRRVLYAYNRKGRLADESSYGLSDEQSLINRILYSYHSSGALKQEMWYRGSDLLIDDISYLNHEYDHRGNWIIRRQVRHQYYDKNMPTHQTDWAYREITYY